MEMCPKDVVDIRVPRRDDRDRLRSPPIIEQKENLDPHIIIGEKSIQLQKKKEKPALCEKCLQFRQPQQFLQSNREFCAELLQKRIVYNNRGDVCFYYKEPHKARNKKICREYTIEATTQNKIRLNKCNAYTAKETLGYRGRKTYAGAAKERGESEREKRSNKPTTNNLPNEEERRTHG